VHTQEEPGLKEGGQVTLKSHPPFACGTTVILDYHNLERILYYNADAGRPSFERQNEVNREYTSSWRLIGYCGAYLGFGC
jgi:hypothetical protein